MRHDTVLDEAGPFLLARVAQPRRQRPASLRGVTIPRHGRIRVAGGNQREEPSERRPVDARRDDLHRVQEQQPAEDFQGLGDLKRLDANTVEELGRLRAALHEAGAHDRAPVDRQCREAGAAPVVGESVEKRIAGVVAGLSRGSAHGGVRREADEVVEVAIAGGDMQVPRPRRLGLHHSCDALLIERGQQVVVEHHGGVKHAAQRQSGGGHLLKHALDVGPSCHVTAGVDDRNA